jgi:galacturonokinase
MCFLKQGIVGFLEGSKGFEGCGVSSSAAVGVAFLLALEHANGLVISPEENIELDWLIENGYLGLCNGVLDQSAILLSKRNCLTAIHCLVFPLFCTSGDTTFFSLYKRWI